MCETFAKADNIILGCIKSVKKYTSVSQSGMGTRHGRDIVLC